MPNKRATRSFGQRDADQKIGGEQSRHRRGPGEQKAPRWIDRDQHADDEAEKRERRLRRERRRDKREGGVKEIQAARAAAPRAQAGPHRCPRRPAVRSPSEAAAMRPA